MCDYRTLKEEDLREIDVYFPPKDSGLRYATLSDGDRFLIHYLKHNPEQTWYYCEAMEPGECLLIKCFDSIQDGKTARRVPIRPLSIQGMWRTRKERALRLDALSSMRINH
ncbi:hypothetical protein LTR37_018292 [Vermiconidia calcicola]|uniref:Uncharacterized protein n=1 Tax=Vermiconidia calcicola TaxID=1690605 RepID=A0ACC3MIL3_9PEZI|nr:hypothetical protein LTR37_018292 [Vermiconidia calcicola]